MHRQPPVVRLEHPLVKDLNVSIQLCCLEFQRQAAPGLRGWDPRTQTVPDLPSPRAAPGAPPARSTGGRRAPRLPRTPPPLRRHPALREWRFPLCPQKAQLQAGPARPGRRPEGPPRCTQGAGSGRWGPPTPRPAARQH